MRYIFVLSVTLVCPVCFGAPRTRSLSLLQFHVLFSFSTIHPLTTSAANSNSPLTTDVLIICSTYKLTAIHLDLFLNFYSQLFF
jgi:hypothetical protein